MFSDGFIYDFNNMQNSFCIFAAFTGMWLGHRIKLALKGWAFKFVAPSIQVLLKYACFGDLIKISRGPLLQVDLLKNQKSDKVDVTIHPEELEDLDDVLAAK
jgi:hypothetical protein